MADANTALIDHILSLDADTRVKLLVSLDDDDRAALARLLDQRLANPLYAYRGNHLAFVKKGLGEGTWSGQDRILEAVDKYQKVVVVATHSIGKSHISARVALGTGCTWDPGLARVTTTATNYRQVSNILWPYIRRTHAQYDLPGSVMKSPRWSIGSELIADGFSAAASDETATQGMHANGELLLIVDEAGGIPDLLGRAFNSLLSSEDAHALVFGNAPSDREGSWFEKICQPDSGWHVIKISAFDTPNFTGEVPDVCTTCPPTIERHTVAKHLTSEKWVKEIADEFGVESPFYIARVLAQFPKNTTAKTLPLAWLEAAQIKEEEGTLDEWIDSLEPSPVRLGVDIASDGGDELVVSWVMGLNGWVADHTSGDAIASPRQAAQFILNQIQLAELFHAEHGIKDQVRVKYDAIGLGWGVGGILEEYKEQGRHNAELVPVDVSEKASEPEKYVNQRAEMWWSMRTWIEPHPLPAQYDERGNPITESTGHIRIGNRELAQLNGPTYKVTNGRIQIEAKDSLRKQGRRSPDRAEALLLAFFEPPRFEVTTPDAELVPILSQSNQWDFSSL